MSPIGSPPPLAAPPNPPFKSTDSCVVFCVVPSIEPLLVCMWGVQPGGSIKPLRTLPREGRGSGSSDLAARRLCFLCRATTASRTALRWCSVRTCLLLHRRTKNVQGCSAAPEDFSCLTAVLLCDGFVLVPHCVCARVRACVRACVCVRRCVCLLEAHFWVMRSGGGMFWITTSSVIEDGYAPTFGRDMEVRRRLCLGSTMPGRAGRSDTTGAGVKFRGGGELRGANFAVQKSGEAPPPPHGEIFAACDQQLHCEFRCRRIRSPPGNNSKPQDCWKWRNYPLEEPLRTPAPPLRCKLRILRSCSGSGPGPHGSILPSASERR